MKTLGIVFAIAAFIACAWIFQQNAPLVLSYIKDLGWLAPVLFVLFYCLATILLLPTMVLTFAGGALFGPVLGVLFNLIGATAGAACAFCISRHLATNWFTSRRGPKINKLISGVERSGWQFVGLIRLIPIIPFNLVNYGLGLTQIKFRHYVITTFIFLTPGEIIYTYCGHAGMDALTHPTPFYKSSSIITLIILGFLLLTFKLFKSYQRRQQAKYQQSEFR
ncbi:MULTISPECIES: TVP38/TMEM64 family protein [unclassified Legionella]|uniref:TVP38/TMEM64 family protein n=1 Tax=unclassified Legionella TaxID=2622702 RepID=UPI001E5633CA|nr:TVP38/TMEM64 family protein [Legionella sp. 31fI33]MCC5014211.1 TVP38/TMEM64 family protein [Legionella sp. 31fI33]